MFENLATGEEGVLQQIIEKYGDELLIRILRILPNRHIAEEILMDVFQELWAQRIKVAQMDYPRAWLFRVAYNKAVDRFRKEAHYPTVSLDHLSSVDYVKHVDDEYDSKEINKMIYQAIEQLPPKEKRIYILSVIENWPVKKIAEVLGRSPNTVRNELVIARKTLRRIISNYLKFFLV